MANPDAIAWLESLPEYDHAKMFTPAMPCVAARGVEELLFTVKMDHQPCAFCPDWEQR